MKTVAGIAFFAIWVKDWEVSASGLIGFAALTSPAGGTTNKSAAVKAAKVFLHFMGRFSLFSVVGADYIGEDPKWQRGEKELRSIKFLVHRQDF
jgi:hypothetical protein